MPRARRHRRAKPSAAAVQCCTKWTPCTADIRALRLCARPQVQGAINVPGATPHEQSARLLLVGRRPDGTPVVEHMAVFARGARVYQAMVVGDRPDTDAVEMFFDGLKVRP